jgi:tRNA dimethylallyltransferase
VTTRRALVLAGPTAAGKSAIGLDVAEALGGVILSADAMQVYRGMDVGTASPSAEERARVPHFAIDVVHPTDLFSAGDFLAEAERAFATGRPVVVVGGTALYLRALQRGLAETPPIPPEIRARVAAEPDPHGLLQTLDPPLAARLHPTDLQRIQRGLEVALTTGSRLSALQAAHAAQPDRVEVRGLWIDPPDLDARIDARVLDMVARGYVAEVEALLEAGVPRDARPMRSLGYRHLCDHLLDGLPLDEAIRRTQRDTRRFARKQRTWRKQLPVVDAGPDPRAEALALVAGWGLGPAAGSG